MVSFRRRIATLIYDTIAVLMVLYFAAFIPVVLTGEALKPGNYLFFMYLVSVCFAYFHICWSRGRTLGMQAWKIEIRRADGLPVDFRSSLTRFAGAWVSFVALGAGYWAALFNPARHCWHDRWSATELRERAPTT